MLSQCLGRNARLICLGCRSDMPLIKHDLVLQVDNGEKEDWRGCNRVMYSNMYENDTLSSSKQGTVACSRHGNYRIREIPLTPCKCSIRSRGVVSNNFRER